MKLILLIILFFIAGTGIFQPVSTQPECLMIEDFQKYNGKPFPDWSFREDYSEASAIYSIIEENGKKFLRGSTVHANYLVQLAKQVNQHDETNPNSICWDIHSFPCISWEWRVNIIPDGGNENDERTNDSAASIYVVFQKRKGAFGGWKYQPANWLKYVWSSTLPVGTVISRKFSKFGISLYDGRYIVVASGNKNLGKWITFRRNVLADYEAYFGEKPRFNPIVVGILTDSNSTGTKAESDYDNITASAL